MPLEINGVEVETVHLDGVEVEDLYLNGVNVFEKYTTIASFVTVNKDNGLSITFRESAAHPSGDIVIVGAVSGGDYYIGRWTTTGTNVWSKSVRDGDGNRVQILDVACSSNGDIVVVGRALNRYLAVSKWSATGTHMWSKGLNGASFKHDTYNAVTALPNGDIMVAGHQNSYNQNSSSGDFLISKWLSDGTHSWTKTDGGYSNDIYHEMTTLSSGDIVVVGEGQYGAVISRWTPTQVLVWSKVLNFNSSNIYNGVDVHPSGDLIAVGAAGNDYAIISRYNDDGTHVWTHRLSSLIGTLQDVAVLTNGDIVAVGDRYTANFRGTRQALVTKWSDNGTLLWSWVQTAGTTTIYTVTATPDGGAVIAGNIPNASIMTLASTDTPGDISTGTSTTTWSSAFISTPNIGTTPGDPLTGFRDLYYTASTKTITDVVPDIYVT